MNARRKRDSKIVNNPVRECDWALEGCVGIDVGSDDVDVGNLTEEGKSKRVGVHDGEDELGEGLRLRSETGPHLIDLFGADEAREHDLGGGEVAGDVGEESDEREADGLDDGSENGDARFDGVDQAVDGAGADGLGGLVRF